MKPFRPPSVTTKMYKHSLVKLRKIKNKENKDGLVILEEIIEKKHKELFKK